jgi:ADP-heptose:LPS heptosyltransferase
MNVMKGWAGVARLGGIGDNLIAASVLAPLKRLGYMVEVIASSPQHVVFHHNPHIDKLSVKNVEQDLPQNDIQAWQKWFESRSHEYDHFVHLSHSCEGRHALFKNNTSFYWSPEYRRKLCAGSYLETVHDIAGVPYEFGPLFYTSTEEKQHAQADKAKVGPRCIAWVLSGTRIDKIYPYAPLTIARILQELHIPVILFGATGKEEMMAKIILEVVEQHHNTSQGLHLALSPHDAEEKGNYGQVWSLRRSLALLQACDLVITPDTGPAWSVAFEPMPKIMLLSHASVENITKHWVNTVTLHADPEKVPCWPCHRLHDDPSTCVPNKENTGASCISDISVERILTTVRDIWQGEKNIIHAEDLFATVRHEKI